MAKLKIAPVGIIVCLTIDALALALAAQAANWEQIDEVLPTEFDGCKWVTCFEY
jgi:hypothetical protein